MKENDIRENRRNSVNSTHNNSEQRCEFYLPIIFFQLLFFDRTCMTHKIYISIITVIFLLYIYRYINIYMYMLHKVISTR